MTKTVKRATIVLALTPVLSVPAAALAATTPIAPVVTHAGLTGQSSTHSTTASTHTTRTSTARPAAKAASTATTTVTHTDAPAATASATAANVLGLVVVGDTSTEAGSSGGKAHAHALDIAGQTVSGDDTTDGSKKGALFTLPDNPLAALELAPYAGSVAHAGGGTQSSAEAALAHANLGGGLLELWVLHSVSNSTWTPDASHGHSSSDGAEANLGGGALDVKVLHAETDSNGKGSSALVVLNGTGIGTSDQLGSACQLNADPLVDLLCLQASGGAGSNGTTTQNAFVGKVTGALPGTIVTGASSSGGHVQAPGKPAGPPTTTPNHPRGPLPHTGPGTSHLPFTGGPIALLSAYAAALVGLGAGLVTAARRRRGGALA